MGKKVSWATDTHLDFTNKEVLNDFICSVNSQCPDYLFLGGDTAESQDICSYLKVLDEKINSIICFTVGNHDFYRSSIAKVKKKLNDLVKSSDKLFFLDEISYIELSEDCALIGNICWADGRLGNAEKSNKMINDQILIKDFLNTPDEKLFQKMNALGDESAYLIKDNLEKALKKYKNVICLTHVPPFKESCLYDGMPVSDDYLPFFSCKAAGDVMLEVMQKRTDSNLLVLSGHTHSQSKIRILENLIVFTGKAKYHAPEVQELIDIEDFFRLM
jgi:predicted MPP superfamily phosphohydrolase